MISRFRSPLMPADFSKQKAFTLVEVLLVCSLVSVIAVSLFQSLASGLKVWERGRLAAKEDAVALFFEKISQDLTNAVSFSQIPFSGINGRVSFAAVIRNFSSPESNSPQDPAFAQIGRIEYFFNPEEKSLCYRRANYGLALKQEFFPEVILIDDLRSVTFRYLYLSEKKLVVRDKADAGVPRGVMVEVGFGTNKDYRQMRRFIPIPIGS